MLLIEAKDYNDMSRKAANIISAQVIMKPHAVLGLATGSTPVGAYHYLGSWRHAGHRPRLHRVGHRQSGAAHVHRWHGHHGQPVLQLHRGSFRHLGIHRSAVRLSARKTRRAAQPHRRVEI